VSLEAPEHTAKFLFLLKLIGEAQFGTLMMERWKLVKTLFKWKKIEESL
jgi:hypothetical protein